MKALRRSIDRFISLVRDRRPGWSERDIQSVLAKIGSAAGNSGAILKITSREWRALCELNRRSQAASRRTTLRFLGHIEGRGLYQMVLIKPETSSADEGASPGHEGISETTKAQRS